jgi:hypothetical protein
VFLLGVSTYTIGKTIAKLDKTMGKSKTAFFHSRVDKVVIFFKDDGGEDDM